MARMLRKITGRVGDLPARVALNVIGRRPINMLLASRYRRALAAYQTELPVLTETDRAIVAALERDGIFSTSLDALGIQGGDAMLRAAQSAAADTADQARRDAAQGRSFNVVPAEAVMARPAMFLWGLQDRLLDIAEAYLGLPVAYDGMNIIYTVADGREVATRQWHRDREDRKMLKIAVYCNDVGPGGGAFQHISLLDSRQGDAQGFRYVAGSPAELTRLFGAGYAGAIRSCEGKAGTVIFSDTARFFHRGDPVMTQDRAAIFFSYFSRRTRHPFFCERSGLSRAQIVQLAEGLPPRQRAALLWHDALPALVRWIPPAPV